MTRHLVVINRHGGGHRRLGGAIDLLRRSIQVDVVETPAKTDVGEALAGSDAHTVVVGGGDGTVHEVVRSLRRLGRLGDVAVGVLPLGTGNDLARSLGIPLDPAEAALALIRGQRRSIDILVEWRGGVAVNAAHLGLGAEAAEMSDGLKGLLGPTAYPVGAALAGIRETPWAVEVRVDGHRVVDGPVLMVGIGNGRTIGGGTVLFPEARMDDGMLDVTVVMPVGRLARAGLAADVRAGRSDRRDDVVSVQGSTVVVEGEHFRNDADGEVSEPTTRVEYRVEPGALQVIVPGT